MALVGWVLAAASFGWWQYFRGYRRALREFRGHLDLFKNNTYPGNVLRLERKRR